MDPSYDPHAVERAAQAYWDDHDSFRVTEDPAREKFYCLSMFPYPSGALHVGHVRNYTIGDVISRFKRMRGYNVLQPMGWDAFGLPAENAAMQNNVPPAKWTRENIAYMRSQLKRLGFGYDWSRELATCDPSYYRWEQWLFTRLLDKGLAYRKSAEVNWDPVDQTVLANEQVIEGRGWRSGAEVERREIPQWFLRITDYAEELLDALGRMDGWPDAVRTMQRNWIGKSRGVEIRFEVDGDPEHPLDVFTTRPDTLLGATYMAVAAEHPLALAAARDDPDIARLRRRVPPRRAPPRPTLEQLGEEGRADRPRGASTRSPASACRSSSPTSCSWATATGAIMAVPAHDQRDWEFARSMACRSAQVIDAADGSACRRLTQRRFQRRRRRWSTPATFDGLDLGRGLRAHRRPSSRPTARASVRCNYRLRDWGVSRQRYWGAPIPVIHCDACGAVPVPDEDLPVELPEDIELPESGGSPLKPDPTFYVAVDLPVVRQGGAARDRHLRHLRRVVAGTYARYACADNDSGHARRARRTTGCRWTSTSAASSMRSCTCSTRASSTRLHARRGPGRAPMSPSPTCSPRAWC
ncbi:MAG: leucine--tRNA ligase [Halofilum sp. (in: g-proteobacteria)]|nr:leucine--tRNA ligase [Halofilum sp. (in: g-proteobacteria)]